jgi:hypothetical protein
MYKREVDTDGRTVWTVTKLAAGWGAVNATEVGGANNKLATSNNKSNRRLDGIL